MTAFDSWESYFYPETLYSGTPVLVNILDIRDTQELRNVEYALTDDRRKELRETPSLIKRTFDGSHLKAIHRYLFQDVYEWAGQYRNVGIRKGTHNFASLSEIDRYIQYAASIIRSSDWQTLTATEFCKKAAWIFAYLNQAHPFREGNGRTTREFMVHVSELSPYRLDFSRIENAEAWNLASKQSAPLPGLFEPKWEALIPQFKIALVTPKPRTRADLAAKIQAQTQAKLEQKTETIKDTKPPIKPKQSR